MGLFSFLKKDKEEKINNSDNEFLDIEASMYDTEATPQTFEDNVNYQNLVYNPPKNDIISYKANRNDIGIVVDKDQFCYNINDFNSNVKTYELEKSTDEERIQLKQEFVEDKKIFNESIQEMNNSTQLQPTNIDENQVNNSFEKEKVLSSENKETNVTDEFSIFGSKDDAEKEVMHEATVYKGKPVELTRNVKFTKEGYKICPNCGTILKPDAPICFMCSNSFIKK